MDLAFYGHPFSSYCQKVLIALYENGTPFEYRTLATVDAQPMADVERLWPLKRFPVVVADGRTIVESSIIIEFLGLNCCGPMPLIPATPGAALEVRMMDRFFDQYVATPLTRIVADRMRKVAARDAQGVAEARQQLEIAYRWLDDTLAEREWAAGNDFSLADCAAAPALFYADWAHPINTEFAILRAYRQRLLARPSVARAVDEARPYRSLFPLGAPDRD